MAIGVVYPCANQRRERDVGVVVLEAAVESNAEHAPAALELQKAVTLSGESPDEIAELARAHAAAGRRAGALEMLGRLQALSRDRYVSPTALASVHASLGDRDSAFASLDRAYAERDFLLVMVRVEPMFDPLRRDPRFAELVTRMKLGPS